MRMGRWELKLDFPACSALYYCFGKTRQKFQSPVLKLLLFPGKNQTSCPYPQPALNSHQLSWASNLALVPLHFQRSGTAALAPPLLCTWFSTHHTTAPHHAHPLLTPEPHPITEHSPRSVAHLPTLTSVPTKNRSKMNTKTHPPLYSQVIATLQVAVPFRYCYPSLATTTATIHKS